MVEAVLEGGPAELPTELRVHLVDEDQAKVRVPYCGGYEHFERVDNAGGTKQVVYRWSYRTRVAE